MLKESLTFFSRHLLKLRACKIAVKSDILIYKKIYKLNENVSKLI